MANRVSAVESFLDDFTLVLGSVLSFFGLWAAPLQPVAVAQEVYPGWHTNLARAAEIAAVSKKPIFVVFRCVR